MADTDATLPTAMALNIMDKADKLGWYYAPLFDGVYTREKMEAHLNANPDCAMSLVVNYLPDYADSIDVSMVDGELMLVLEDNFYYKSQTIESLDELEVTVMAMLKSYHE